MSPCKRHWARGPLQFEVAQGFLTWRCNVKDVENVCAWSGAVARIPCLEYLLFSHSTTTGLSPIDISHSALLILNRPVSKEIPLFPLPLNQSPPCDPWHSGGACESRKTTSALARGGQSQGCALLEPDYAFAYSTPWGLDMSLYMKQMVQNCVTQWWINLLESQTYTLYYITVN